MLRLAMKKYLWCAAKVKLVVFKKYVAFGNEKIFMGTTSFSRRCRIFTLGVTRYGRWC